MMTLSAHTKSIIILIILVFITFFNSIQNGFVGDDNLVVVNNTFYNSFHNLPRLFDKSYTTQPQQIMATGTADYGSGSVAYRPVLSLTYFFDHAIYHLNASGYHFTNFLIHLANVILVYWLVYSLFQKVPLSVFGALIFGLHPLRTEAVCCIGYRADLLGTFFILSALLCYVRFKNNQRFIFFFILSCLFFLLALFSKESTISFWGIFFIYDWFFKEKSFKETLRKNFQYYAWFAVITAFYLYAYVVLFPNSSLSGQPLMGGNLLKHIGNIFIIFGEYVSKFVFPFAVKTLPPQYKPPIDSFWTYKAISSGLVFILFVYLCVHLWKQKNKMCFVLLWFLVGFIPISNVIPLANPMAFRFTYLPSIGLSIFLAYFFIDVFSRASILKNNPKSIYIFKMGFLLSCISVTMILNMRWQNGPVMTMAMLKDYPDDPAGYLYGAEILLHVGRSSEARHMLEQGLKLGLKDYRAYLDLGVATMGSYPESEFYFRQGLKQYPQFGTLYTGLGRSLLLQKKLEEALPVLEQAVMLSPGYSSFGYLIQVYLLSGQTQKADVVLQQALRAINNELYKKSLQKFFTVSVKELPVDIGI